MDENAVTQEEVQALSKLKGVNVIEQLESKPIPVVMEPDGVIVGHCQLSHVKNGTEVFAVMVFDTPNAEWIAERIQSGLVGQFSIVEQGI